jgi:DNA-binding transcriptional regulator GbsR (MarR family)
MNVAQQLEKHFMEHSFGMAKAMGLPDLHAKLAGILFLSIEPICLDELAKKSGYSLSGVSTAMNFLENIGRVKKFRKPGSRKIYYETEHDFAKFTCEMFKKAREGKIKPAKEFLPELIKKYEERAKTHKELKAKLDIMKNSYKQMIKVDEIMKKAIEEMSKL